MAPFGGALPLAGGSALLAGPAGCRAQLAQQPLLPQQLLQPQHSLHQKPLSRRGARPLVPPPGRQALSCIASASGQVSPLL